MHLYSALLEEHFQFDVLHDAYLTPEKLEQRGYKTIILAGAACLSDGKADLIKSFVENGGGLLVTGWTGWADSEGALRPKPALANLCGVEPLPLPPIVVPGIYMKPATDSISPAVAAALRGIEEIGLVTADGPTPAMAAKNSAITAMQLYRHLTVSPIEAVDRPHDTGLAGVVLNRVGAGRVATVSIPIDALYYRFGLGVHRQLIANLLDWCAGSNSTDTPRPLETDAPETVEVTLARNGRQRIIHFVNSTGLRPLRDLIPVQTGTTRVWIDDGERCLSARTLVQEGSLRFAQKGNAVEFDLGILGDYEVVILDVVER